MGKEIAVYKYNGILLSHKDKKLRFVLMFSVGIRGQSNLPPWHEEKDAGGIMSYSGGD